MNSYNKEQTEKSNIQINDTVYKTLEDKNLYIFAIKVSKIFIG